MQKFDVCFKDGETRRLDVFIADTASLTRSHAVKLIEGGDVLVNGKSADKKYKLRVGDKVEITIPDPEIRGLVKAADKISALIKCVEERQMGNTDFASAEKSTYNAIKKLNVPEAEVFLEEFMPSYLLTLDEQA